MSEREHVNMREDRWVDERTVTVATAFRVREQVVVVSTERGRCPLCVSGHSFTGVLRMTNRISMKRCILVPQVPFERKRLTLHARRNLDVTV